MKHRSKKDLTRGALVFLSQIKESENIHSLSIRIDMTYAHASRLAKMMIQKELLVSKKLKGKRAKQLILTEKGKKLQKAALVLLYEW